MEHAERNCIYNAARVGTPLDGCIFYVTGIPCLDCARAIYQIGALELVMLNITYSSIKKESYEFLDFIKSYMKVRYIENE